MFPFSVFFHHYLGLLSCFVRISITHAKIQEKKCVSFNACTANTFYMEIYLSAIRLHMFVLSASELNHVSPAYRLKPMTEKERFKAAQQK